MSGITALRGTTQTNALRQSVGGQCEAYGVSSRVGEETESFEKSQRLQYGGIDANAYGWVSFLDALQGRATCEGAAGHHARRQAAASPSVAEVMP